MDVWCWLGWVFEGSFFVVRKQCCVNINANWVVDMSEYQDSAM